jgi:uncharacterized protein YrzB (UPF0473 family)
MSEEDAADPKKVKEVIRKHYTADPGEGLFKVYDEETWDMIEEVAGEN